MTGFLLALAMQLHPVASPDSVEKIRRTARDAEMRYERLARALAPLKGGSTGSECDEVVGRFCLTFNDDELPQPEPEVGRVTDARRAAIEALRHAFSFEPGRLETTGPLVRYLVEDDRATEAVSAARTYAALTADSVWGPLLLGFALHAAGEDAAAEGEFERGLGALGEGERRKIEDVRWLLSSDDRGVWGELSPEEREEAARRLWRHSDPLYLTPGNERRMEHIARHVWSRLLAMTPVVTGMVRWGDDLTQLTVRYGVPTARTRTYGTVYREGGLVEHYDPEQLTFDQEDLLSRGSAATPPPGEEWDLEAPKGRTGYAPRTVRRIVALDHQVTRFPDGDTVVLRVDGHFVRDSLVTAGTAVRTALWALEEQGFEALDSVFGVVHASVDSVPVTLELRLSPDSMVYSFEALESASGLASRARYALDLDLGCTSLCISDPLLAEPFGAEPPETRDDERLRPLARLELRAGQEIGLYAEAEGLRQSADGSSAYRVELAIRRADRAAFPARALNWIGRKLGLADEHVPPRVAWDARAEGSARLRIAVNLGLDDLPEGLHAVSVSLTDLVSGDVTTSQKLIRIGAR